MEKDIKTNLTEQKEHFISFQDAALEEPFLIRRSANAWWNDVGKVRDLMRGFKMGFNVQESRVLAGISRDQYYYFLKEHPEFSDIKERLETLMSIKAKQVVARDLDNINTAKWYLTHIANRRGNDELDEEQGVKCPRPHLDDPNDIADIELVRRSRKIANQIRKSKDE